MNNTPFHLTGKTILVTGASSGIGAQCAITISEMGATVIITGRNENRLQQTLEKLEGKGHLSFAADLTDDNKVKEFAGFVPAIDGVVHCAGIVTVFPIKYINRQKIDESFSINYVAPVLLMTALFSKKKINHHASIVFISSFSGTYPYTGGALYAGTKAALEKYSIVLATEHAHNGIRSNCISPAMVKTGVLDETFAGDRSKYIDLVKERHLLGFGETVDIANMSVFLLSDAAKRLTAQNIILDGGYLLGLVSKITND